MTTAVAVSVASYSSCRIFSLHRISQTPPLPPPPYSLSLITPAGKTRPKRRSICCEAGLKSDSSSSILVDGDASASQDEEDDELKENLEKVGRRVRVISPVKVYHVPKMPEFELTPGTEGVIKQYAGFWKGKRISANLPFKVEFLVDIPDRGPVKFFAHLKEDEFEFI